MLTILLDLSRPSAISSQLLIELQQLLRKISGEILDCKMACAKSKMFYWKEKASIQMFKKSSRNFNGREEIAQGHINWNGIYCIISHPIYKANCAAEILKSQRTKEVFYFYIDFVTKCWITLPPYCSSSKTLVFSPKAHPLCALKKSSNFHGNFTNQLFWGIACRLGHTLDTFLCALCP